MCIVAALLSAKVRTIVIVGAVLGAKTLLRSAGLDQRAVYCEVLVGHELLRLPVYLDRCAILDIAQSADSAVPEPTSLMLLGTGLLGLAFVVFRDAKPTSLHVSPYSSLHCLFQSSGS